MYHVADPGAKKRRALKHPRPGHADLSGALKYLTDDLREVLERASARETTSRGAAGGLAKALLGAAGIEVRSHVLRIGRAAVGGEPTRWEALAAVEESPGLAGPGSGKCYDREIDAARKRAIPWARFGVVALGPARSRDLAHWTARGRRGLAHALMSIHSVMRSLGEVYGARAPCSAFHDEILFVLRARAAPSDQRAGGLEGCITNGEELRAQPWSSPSHAADPAAVVDLRPGTHMGPWSAATLRVPAAASWRGMVAWVLADALLENSARQPGRARRAIEERGVCARVPLGR